MKPFGLFLCVVVSATMAYVWEATAASPDVWFKNPHKPLRAGESAFSARARSGPLKPDYKIASLKIREVSRQGQQIEGYIFGVGRPDKTSTNMVEVLTKLSLTGESKTMEVPEIGLRDLARLKLPESLTVFRVGKFVIVEIYGPDGSEGYEVQFVSDGTRFLYRLVRHGSYGEAFLAKYPDPLRLDFQRRPRR
jgi:hypothetical protein